MQNPRGKLLAGDQVLVDSVEVSLEQTPSGPLWADLAQVTVPLASMLSLLRVDRLAVDNRQSWDIKVRRITSNADQGTATGYFEMEGEPISRSEG
jgi:hypothetical protein